MIGTLIHKCTHHFEIREFLQLFKCLLCQPEFIPSVPCSDYCSMSSEVNLKRNEPTIVMYIPLLSVC